MATKTVFRKIFGESPLIKVIDFFLDNQEWDYTKIQIATDASISRVTLDQIIEKLLKIGFIKKTRTVGNSKFYQINKESIVVQNLIQLDLNISLGKAPPIAMKPAHRVPA